MESCCVSEVAREISQRYGQTIAPHLISYLFYKRKLDDRRCPVVGRARAIPRDYVPVIEEVLRENGILRGTATPPINE